MSKKVGDKVYYKGLFGKLKKCTIVKVIPHLVIEWTGTGAFPHHIYQYIVKFENGKEKLINDKKIL